MKSGFQCKADQSSTGFPRQLKFSLNCRNVESAFCFSEKPTGRLNNESWLAFDDKKNLKIMDLIFLKQNKQRFCQIQVHNLKGAFKLKGVK